jgi:hypothetical protein
MARSYRIYTIAFNLFLLVAICITVYEFFAGGYDNSIGSALAALVGLYFMVTTTYYLRMSWHTAMRWSHVPVKAAEDPSAVRWQHRPLGRVAGYSNLVLGAGLVLSAFLVLVLFPITDLFDSEELLRLLVLIALLVHGTLTFRHAWLLLFKVGRTEVRAGTM